MKIGIYTPYLPVLGGGEKYIGKLAEILSKENDVTFVVPAKPDFEKLEERLNIDLGRVSIDNMRNPASLIYGKPGILLNYVNAYRVSRRTKSYDLFINQEYMTYIPSYSRRSIFICQAPPVSSYKNYNALIDLLFDARMKTYNSIIVYSCYTKSWAEKYYRKEAIVLYPPVDTASFVASVKENIILSVGRFSTSFHSKKQLEMVKAFEKLYDQEKLVDWEYHLVGGLTNNIKDHQYLEACKKAATGYPISFHVNAPFQILRDLYGRAKIFWHATGLGEDENHHPERMEHFGITTIEAMSAGCVPVVINRGGQPEIVRNGIDGFLWDDVEELKKYTLSSVNDSMLWQKMSKSSMERSQKFGIARFTNEVDRLIGEVKNELGK